MRHTLRLLVCCLLPVASAAGQEKKSERDQFLERTEVLHLKIDLEQKQLDLLRREPRKYARATLREGDQVWTFVGIHVKGAAGSFRGIDDKPGLTLNMDKFHDDQRFHGMDKFHLANSVQDPSYISELICGELFRAAGVPASRVRHAVVTINGRRRGLYYLKEGYDTGFLKTFFKSARGNFYDGGFLREVDQPLQVLSSREDVKKHADLKALVAAANEKDPAVRFEKMERLLNMEAFLSYLVLEVITWDWDGYPMNRNNYRIHHDPVADKITFIPSGMDQMFGNPGGPILPGFQGLIARRVMETPAGKERYLARMAEIRRDVFVPEKLGKRLEDLQAQLQPELAKIDAGAGRDLPNQINRIRQGMVQRAKSIDEQLKRLKK